MFMITSATRETRTIYVFETFEHMSYAIKSKYDTQYMLYAHAALGLSEDTETCTVLKDRSGLLNLGVSCNTKKMLKMLEILVED